MSLNACIVLVFLVLSPYIFPRKENSTLSLLDSISSLSNSVLCGDATYHRNPYQTLVQPLANFTQIAIIGPAPASPQSLVAHTQQPLSPKPPNESKRTQFTSCAGLVSEDSFIPPGCDDGEEYEDSTRHLARSLVCAWRFGELVFPRQRQRDRERERERRQGYHSCPQPWRKQERDGGKQQFDRSIDLSLSLSVCPSCINLSIYLSNFFFFTYLHTNSNTRTHTHTHKTKATQTQHTTSYPKGQVLNATVSKPVIEFQPGPTVQVSS